MKKRITSWSVVYYLLIPCAYIAASLLIGFMTSGGKPSLGRAGTAIMTMLFVITPAIICVFMRFSLLKWYVDPFAAAEIPLLMYLIMVFNNMKREDAGIGAAFANINETLSDGGAVGWLYLAGVFVFGLVTSFSIARKNGKSIGYWWITPLEPKPE